ncbi:hypothetical protein ABBQ38_002103 [Trebouxia sp. C0009 RCD-2024]
MHLPLQHCGGVNALASLPSESKLFTASKDSTVKRWGLQDTQPALEASFEGHSDWVNDIIVVEDVLISCSSDTTVQFWKADQPGAHEPLATFNQHTDYVNCLAGGKSRAKVASAGLRAEVFLWDIQRGIRIHEQSGLYEAKACEGHTGSVYALALNEAGNFLAAGSTEGTIRISDTRSHAVVASLKGHTENIRALLLNDEGTLMVSGSSDHTMKLWDLGQQRCVQTLAVHTDSVWTLLASPDFSVVYSGGRDRCVYRWEVDEQLASVLQPRASIDRASVDLQRLKQQPADGSSAFLAGSSTHARQRQQQDRGAQVQQQHPTHQTSGIPPLVQSAVLTDRRHLLTKDAQGNVELWDITTGAVAERFGKVDFGQKEAELFAPESVPPWFTWDTKLGSLTLHFETPQVFAAEVYAHSMGLETSSEDEKMNIGLETLQGLFVTWTQAIALQQAASQETPDPNQPADSQQPPNPTQSADPQQPPYADGSSGPPSTSGRGPFDYTGAPYPPVVMSTLQGPGQPWDQQPWQMCVSKFTGTEPRNSMIPKWLCDAVLARRIPSVKETKAGFLLMPAQGSGLPSLLQSKLTAPRILPVHKVAVYCQSKLAEQSYHMQLGVVWWYPDKHQETGEAQQQPQGDVLELTCNGMAIPYDLSLAAVRQYIWKRSDDPVLQYGRQNSNKPAPMPIIKPAS